MSNEEIFKLALACVLAIAAFYISKKKDKVKH